MKKITEPKQKRKTTEVRRQEIIDAGMSILANEGARQFTAERLGSAIGIASGTIFRHFGSMDEILDAIVDRIEEIIFENFPPQASDSLESLRLFFEARVRAISEHQEVSKLLFTSMLIPSGKDRYREKRLHEFKVRSRCYVMDCLKKAEAEGLLAEDVLPEECGILVLGAMYSLSQTSVKAKSGKDQSGLVKRIWRLLEKSWK